MTKLHFITLATAIFSFVFLFHVLRLITGFDVVMGGVNIPMWASWAGAIVSGILVLYGKITWTR